MTHIIQGDGKMSITTQCPHCNRYGKHEVQIFLYPEVKKDGRKKNSL